MLKKNLMRFFVGSLSCLPLSLFAQDPIALEKTQKTLSIDFSPHSIDLREVFNASPLIYSILLLISMCSFAIWLYTLFSLRSKDIMTSEMLKTLRHLLANKNYEEALKYCHVKNTLLTKMLLCGISTRTHGLQFMLDRMKTEGKRLTATFWHRISILNDIVLIAPMLGLLGTVLGMFYAFYDSNRSIETITRIFDGLGLAVGTTVAGLLVAIVSMVFYTMLKYRFFRILNLVENEALSLSSLIETKKPSAGVSPHDESHS